MNDPLLRFYEAYSFGIGGVLQTPPWLSKSRLSDLAFRSACIFDEDRKRAKLEERFKYSGPDDLLEVTSDSFAKSLKWNIPDAEERTKRLADLMANPETPRGKADLELLVFNSLDECLRIFTTRFQAKTEEEYNNLPEFTKRVFPFVYAVRENAAWIDHSYDSPLDYHPPITLGDKWFSWQSAYNYLDWYDWSQRTNQEDVENAANQAIESAQTMLMDLYTELHPANRSIKSVARVVGALVKTISFTSDNTVGRVASAKAGIVIQKWIDPLERLATIKQATRKEVDNTIAVLSGLVSALESCEAPDRDTLCQFLSWLIDDFKRETAPLCLLPVFNPPVLTPYDYMTMGQANLPIAQMDRIKEPPSMTLQVKPEETPPPPGPQIPRPSYEPRFYLYGSPDDMALIEHHFDNNGYVLNFSNSQFDAFTTRSIGVPIQKRYGGSKAKSLAAYFAQVHDDEKIIKLCEDLLNHEDRYFPIADADPGNVAERKRIRELIAKVRSQPPPPDPNAWQKKSDDSWVAPWRKPQGTQPPTPPQPPPTPAATTPPAQPPSQTTSKPSAADQYLPEVVDLLKKSLEAQKQTASNTAGTKTATQNATRAIKDGNAVEAKALEAERQTAESTAKIAESLAIRQAESEGIWTRAGHPEMRPCVHQCEIKKSIWFTNEKQPRIITAPKAWEYLEKLLCAPGDGFVELPTNFRSAFSGKPDVAAVCARIVAQSGPGSSGTGKFRLE